MLGTSDYITKNGFTDVLVGLSGGVDSSLVATIAADALGAERVHGVLMPSRYSSAGSLEDAGALAANLGIDTCTVADRASPPACSWRCSSRCSAGGDPAAGLAGENLQARIRGVILMAISNERGWLVLTTGNKSEMAVGYATLYGDMAGGYAVLKDVPKTLVYELCEYRNSLAGLRPRSRGPSSQAPVGGAAPGPARRREPASLRRPGPDPRGLCRADLTVADLVAAGFDAATVRRVIDLVDRAEYKRRQAPPGPTGHEPRLRQGPADADHEPVPGLGRDGGLGPLSTPSAS